MEDGGIQGFSLLGWDFTGNQREEARMIDVVMDYRWRYQYELWLAYYRYRWTDIDI